MSTMHRVPRPFALTVAAAAVVWSGCADRVSGPSAARTAASAAAGAGAPATGEATASARWSAITRDLIAAKPAAEKPTQQAGFRAFAYLSLAQYRAVVAADESRGRPPHASPQGAVAAAAAVVLSALFPADAALFASRLRLQESEAGGSTEAQSEFAAGEAIGRQVGAQVVELARTDRFDAVWTGTVPTGPGYWSSDFDPPRPPQLPLLGRMRPFLMTSGDQFRPVPPPAFGSPAFVAALDEVRRFAETRTPDQLRIAQFWAMPAVAAFWNEEASKRIDRFHLNERRAAYALALMHTAAMDAMIACHDAKYTYWLIRPYRADRGIVPPIGKPNHPSYPSNHSCVSGASADVLAALFPSDADQLLAMADEAGESRLYAGIHYRFDKDAGLGIGRQVAELALSRGVDGARGWPGERRGLVP